MVGGTPQQQIATGPIQEVPEELRRFVQRNQVSYQFATVADPDGYHGRALIIGSPSAEIPTLEIYLVFPLVNEERRAGPARAAGGDHRAGHPAGGAAHPVGRADRQPLRRRSPQGTHAGAR
ncbi:integral membrane sensor signal transduction histidine kinase [Mycobacteroides abscessus subsp. abscessus]|nr:integral membrane sensor signal transduction histidine kinase [Mycobacteroides abscessus subsp. abscessus]